VEDIRWHRMNEAHKQTAKCEQQLKKSSTNDLLYRFSRHDKQAVEQIDHESSQHQNNLTSRHTTLHTNKKGVDTPELLHVGVLAY